MISGLGGRFAKGPVIGSQKRKVLLTGVFFVVCVTIGLLQFR